MLKKSLDNKHADKITMNVHKTDNNFQLKRFHFTFLFH